MADAGDVDDSDESLLSTIFTDGFPENWRENADFTRYLSELSAASVDKLSREPERLEEERSQILEQTQNLAFDNYKTFIKTAECSREIFQDFIAVETNVQGLLDKLPVFHDTATEFLQDAQEINSNRRLNSVILARHTQLLEVLEIPQLMDTCVRNGYYEEALELSSYVRRLEKKLSSIPTVQSIVSEVHSSMQLMLTQLLQQLRTNIQLPACLRVIGYLRRLDVFSESELRIKFLQARDAWFQSLVVSIPSEDPYYHITKVVEASRVHLFDIITQYRAIFSDDDPILSMEDEGSPVYRNLFHGWIVQKVSSFMRVLEHDLERGTGGRLDSVLGQCMYFGLSFSRVGTDFRGLLAPIFQRAAMKNFRISIEQATESFVEKMKSYTLVAPPAMLISTVMTNFASSNKDSEGLSPPVALMEFSPLAVYTNSILTAFNDLRHCSPLALAVRVRDVIHNSIIRVVAETCSFHRSEAAALNEKERELFARFCKIIYKDLVPYLNHCLQVIFPLVNIGTILGSSSREILLADSEKNHQELLGLPIESIITPLRLFLPQEEDPRRKPGDNPDDSDKMKTFSTNDTTNTSETDKMKDEIASSQEKADLGKAQSLQEINSKIETVILLEETQDADKPSVDNTMQ